jgi:hypothetical protein
MMMMIIIIKKNLIIIIIKFNHFIIFKNLCLTIIIIDLKGYYYCS